MFKLIGAQKTDGIESHWLFRALIIIGTCLTFATVGALFLIFLNINPFDTIPNLSLYLTYALILEMLAMISIIAYRFVRIYSNKVGSRLQQRMVGLIAIIVSAPVLLISGFSILFLEVGLETWISKQVKTALEESQNVAEAYLEEHRQSLISDIVSIAQNFDQSFLLKQQQVNDIQVFLDFNTRARQINQALIMRIDANGKSKIIARSGFTASLELEPISRENILQAIKGEVVLILGENIDQAKGLVKLKSTSNLYLYAGRYVSSQVVQQTQIVKGAVRNFTILEKQLQQLKFGFILTFALFTLLCILVGVYLSLTLARSIATPISRLTEAAREVGKGNFKIKVATDNLPQDETAELSETFNIMSETLGTSQEKLIAANSSIAENRDLIESILRSVSTGIIGLDRNAKLLSINQRAADILEVTGKEAKNIDIIDFFPNFAFLITHAKDSRRQEYLEQRQTITLENGTQRILLVRLVQNHGTGALQFILSIDDISELENAQRLAAWSEVAKRIAHEIRNPLTPIRLATERLRRKYPRLLDSIRQQDQTLVSERDIETLQQSSATILRQVDNIASMVREFSDFARMPKANLQDEDIVEICREAAFIEQNREHNLTIKTDLPNTKVAFLCDRHQMLQVLVNLLKNGAEAMVESTESKAKNAQITLRLQQEKRFLCIEIEDQGPGWPTGREKLFDPYHTTRENGTGLGLAIVQRIVNEHKGECHLLDARPSGAVVRLTFPLSFEQNTVVMEK